MIRPELKKIILIFGAWIIIGVVLWVPTNNILALFIPAICILIAISIAAIGIILIRKGFFKPVVVHIKGKPISGCSLGCPYLKLKNNPVNKTYLISKCSAMGMKTVYRPSKVPGWCPYNV